VEKTYSSMSDAIYLKRRTFIGRSYHISQRFMIMLPSFVPWMSSSDLKRFSVESRLPNHRKRKICVSSLDAAFRSCIGKIHGMTEHVRSFFNRYYEKLSLRPYGNVPQLSHVPVGGDGFYPGVDYVGFNDYVEQTIEDLYDGVARIKIRGRDYFHTETFRLVEGLRFKIYSGGGPSFTILKRLGIVKEVSDSTNSREVRGEEGLHLLLEEYRRRKDPNTQRTWSTFKVCRFVPHLWPGTNLLDVEGLLDSDYNT